VHQSIVAGGIVFDLKLAEWMASSPSLYVGIDECTKLTKRSFVGLEIGGQLDSMDPDLHIWCAPQTAKEVVSHSNEKILDVILDEFQQINEIQHDQGLHQSQIYEIMMMMVTFDLTSVGWVVWARS